jgi:hypothetical protein
MSPSPDTKEIFTGHHDTLENEAKKFDPLLKDYT